MKKRKPILSTRRAVEILEEMLWLRRQLYADDQFFKVPEALEAINDEGEIIKIETFSTRELEDYKRKAGSIVFDGKMTLTVDERLFENAKNGGKLSNFTLAHEIGHLVLDHHATNAVIKNFQLFSGPNGMSNIPPTIEEWEANFAAVCFQCGVALLNGQYTAIELANRAFSDVHTVRKVQRLVQLDVFQKELKRPKPKCERVVL